MPDPTDPKKIRYGMIQWFILDTLAKADRPLRINEVRAALDAAVDFSPHEREVGGTKNQPRWRAVAGFQFAPLQAARLILKSPEGFSITGEGRELLTSYPDPYSEHADEIAVLARLAYQEKRRLDGYADSRYAVVGAVLDMLDNDQWVAVSDLADLSGLTATAVLTYLTDTAPEQRVQVLDAQGRELSHANPDLAWALGQRSELQKHGVDFDSTGLADPRSRLYAEEVRPALEESGVIVAPARRAWLVRGSSVDGQDITGLWRDHRFVSLAATKLRPGLTGGMSRDELKAVVDVDYSHASYAKRMSKLDEFLFFLSRMREGDIVATTSQGRLYVGEIAGPPESVSSEDGRSNLRRDVVWVAGEGADYSDLSKELAARLQVQHEVVDLTEQLGELGGLLGAMRDVEPLPPVRELTLPDPDQQLADLLHVPLEWLVECVELLRERPQLIFYGPPGTGKTYLARKVAKHLAGENVRLVQFHPAYSYEDFFEGYRPVAGGGFELRPGPLRQVVEQARDNPTAPYVLIIDEINRGNLAKIFGELYFLLEYRGDAVDLLYAESGDSSGFTLPANVHIVGTMNTADRSIALVDSAMRRRFAFLPLHPDQPPTDGILRSWLSSLEQNSLRADLLDALNARIDDPDFKIGPSYLMTREDPGDELDTWLRRVWKTSILPLLEEHHFGDGTDVGKRYGLDTLRAQLERDAAAASGIGDDDSPAAGPH